MPELPEVESTRRSLSQTLSGHCVHKVVVRERRLRWPTPEMLPQILEGSTLNEVTRRGKYLILHFSSCHLLVHLGMSGSLTTVKKASEVKKHDHIDIIFGSDVIARFHDPRRFGSFHLIPLTSDPNTHPLLFSLGPEPLSENFNGKYLFELAVRTTRVPVKPFLMNSRTVVGVGNIYASEALFRSGIHPKRLASRLSRVRCERLVEAVKEVLAHAIAHGGTTLRDYRHGAGEEGAYREFLKVYEREGEECFSCERIIKKIVLGQRSSYFCPFCQR